MKKKMRIIVFTLILLLLNNSTTVHATPRNSENIFKENIMTYEDCIGIVNNADIYAKKMLIRATKGISDIPITEKMLDLIEVTSINEDGIVEELEVCMTVKELGYVMQDGELGTVYMLNAFAATKSDSGTKSYSKTTAQGTVFWIDHSGVDNELFGVSGSWVTNGDTLTNRIVEYGADNNRSVIKTKYPTSNTFAYTETPGIIGLLLHLESKVDVNGKTLRLRVTSSLFT
ncbi:hypothetical protein LJC58_05465 [Lachnospiraceae bacterium OttesenSCG-928-D06]|nr:hypothetical protein [Lachnospiraceae bacterium OttesenSCG-928-D06]